MHLTSNNESSFIKLLETTATCLYRSIAQSSFCFLYRKKGVYFVASLEEQILVMAIPEEHFPPYPLYPVGGGGEKSGFLFLSESITFCAASLTRAEMV